MIWRYVARDSERFADQLVDRIVGATDRLVPFPRSGRVVPELERPDVREVIVQGHRIIYQIVGEDIEVLTVLHGARRLGDLTV